MHEDNRIYFIKKYLNSTLANNEDDNGLVIKKVLRESINFNKQAAWEKNNRYLNEDSKVLFKKWQII